MGIFSIFKQKKVLKSESVAKVDSLNVVRITPERKKYLDGILTSGGVNELNRRKNELELVKTKKTEIAISKFEDFSIYLSDKELVVVLQRVKASFPLFISKNSNFRTFKNQKELQKYAREELLLFLNNLHLELSTRISLLRKKGHNISYVNFKIMYISSKLRLFKEEMDLKTLEIILSNLAFADNELKKFESPSN